MLLHVVHFRSGMFRNPPCAMTEVKNVCAAYMLADFTSYVYSAWHRTLYLPD